MSKQTIIFIIICRILISFLVDFLIRIEPFRYQLDQIFPGVKYTSLHKVLWYWIIKEVCTWNITVVLRSVYYFSFHCFDWKVLLPAAIQIFAISIWLKCYLLILRVFHFFVGKKCATFLIKRNKYDIAFVEKWVSSCSKWRRYSISQIKLSNTRSSCRWRHGYRFTVIANE